MSTEKTLYENDQWRVTNQHVETLDEDYWFTVDRLGKTRAGTDLPDWPIHLAEKRWIDPVAFMDAFRFALQIHRGRYGCEFTDAQVDQAEIKMFKSKAMNEAFYLAIDRWRSRNNKAINSVFYNAETLCEFGDLWETT